ncbi:cytochrome b/b6 domain-containing protein [Nocardioides humi]|uniref:Cytochrome b561 bacterial/Ni-hydrogenase domain-containing protein n=1 Tax=Nocardioides humi TaxID=449461 RepID=A0ABN2B9F2_9ACTN|nr:cytochrome b/b6 domain-containing protein [Nocardioides humi]
MRLRNDEHGYGAVTRALHWVTVLLLAAQFVVGYTMEADDDRVVRVDCDPPGEDRSGGDTSDAEEDLLDRLEEECEERQERLEEAAEDRPSPAHVTLGLLLLVVALARVIWRRLTPLPPWDPRLGPAGRRLLHASEVSLLTMLFALPLTGLLLVIGSDDLVPLHVAAHVGFFAALAGHLAVVLGYRLLPRMLRL